MPLAVINSIKFLPCPLPLNSSLVIFVAEPVPVTLIAIPPKSLKDKNCPRPVTVNLAALPRWKVLPFPDNKTPWYGETCAGLFHPMKVFREPAQSNS